MFHPMVAGVTIPGMGLFLLVDRAVHRQEPVEQARRPEVRDLDDDDVPDDVGRARHHRFVLPGRGLQLRLPLERRHLLRAVGARSVSTVVDHRHPGRLVLAAVTIFAAGRTPLRRAGHRHAVSGETTSARHQRDATIERRRRVRPSSRRPAASAPTRRRQPRRRARQPRAAARSSSASRSTRKRSASAGGSSSTAASSPTIGFSLGAFGAACLAFLCAKSAGGFGGKVDAGTASPTSSAYIDAKKGRSTCPRRATYLVPYPKARRSRRPRRSCSTRP